MFLKILFIQLYVLSFLSCKNNDKGSEQIQSIKHDSIGANDSVPEFGGQKQDTVILDSSVRMTNRSKIEIVTATKYFDSASAYFDRSKIRCTEWSLNKEDIEKVLLISEDIGSHELHYYYDVFPCYYMGKLKIDGKHAIYTINAGAFSIIEFRDTSIVIGYKKKDHKKYFLLGPGIK